MKFLKFFLPLSVIFALLDPDPDSEYGSGSTDPIDPDPQPCFFSNMSSLGRYVFGSEISYNKAPPRLPGLGC